MDDATEPPEPLMHQYHCVLCGTQLHELGLGILECGKCGTQFVPTVNDSESTASITWELPNARTT